MTSWALSEDREYLVSQRWTEQELGAYGIPISQVPNQANDIKFHSGKGRMIHNFSVAQWGPDDWSYMTLTIVTNDVHSFELLLVENDFVPNYPAQLEAFGTALQYERYDMAFSLAQRAPLPVEVRYSDIPTLEKYHETLKRALRQGQEDIAIRVVYHGYANYTWPRSYTLNVVIAFEAVRLLRVILAKIVDMDEVGWAKTFDFLNGCYQKQKYSKEEGDFDIEKLDQMKAILEGAKAEWEEGGSKSRWHFEPFRF